MAKQIQVNLAFNAETAKAKAQINDLVSSLNKISTKESQIFDDRQLQMAAKAAQDLTKHLEAAVNVNTGKLDLNKFTQSLARSKQSLQDLYNGLAQAGPQGQQAFLQLASSIASSESQVLSLSARVKDLGVTLKNTIKWQLSSSLIHGFMGAMSSAIGYAKDLNSSLNDIRIVTGASVDEMARFAEQANRSAKALSATTTEYTKASLIYYQQGLSDAEVKERADVTIKMANVSKQSAEIVSDQMTAVWNNFADGTKSLEYYADVMTALGAATASSVDEITGGLEKFAAIGDTIGLSFEYAASALATITSNTRQSEEVVGTALKTIFARIQGLNLGETLDDGTTLNKYSAALNKIGISIFDQAGEIKSMDNILDEMGDKWQNLSKAQQIALAQTVAGTRQYTQLIALMDNWNNGDNDSFQANLITAKTSEGALQEQQDIYAESWEAAAERVRTAAEDIYDSLLNDKAIIPLLNGLEKILSFTGSLIDGFGGLKGILLIIGATFTKTFAKEMPGAIEKLKTNLKIMTGAAQKEKIENIGQAQRIIADNKSAFIGGDATRASATISELEDLKKLEVARKHLTDSQYEYLRSKIQEKRASQEVVAAKQDELAALEKEADLKRKRVAQSSASKAKTSQSNINQLEEDKDILTLKKEVLEREKAKIENKTKKSNYHLTTDDIANLEAYTEELRQIEERNAAIEKSIALEIRRQQLLKENNVETEQTDDDGNVTGTEIDQKKYQELISSKSKQLQDKYQEREASRLTVEDLPKQQTSWSLYASSLASTGKAAGSNKEVASLKQSMKNYTADLQKAMKIAGQPIDENSEAFKKLQEVLNDTEASAEDVVAAFEKFAKSLNIDEATDELNKVGTEIKEIQDDLRALDPTGFDRIDSEAREAGEEIANTEHKIQQLKNTSSQIDVKINVDTQQLSSTLTEMASIGMDIGSIFTALSSMISIWGDSSATTMEKVTVSFSSLGMAAMSAMQIFSTLANPSFLKGLTDIGTSLGTAAAKGGAFSGILKKLSGGFTAAGASAGKAALAMGKVLIVILAIVAVAALLKMAFDAIYASTPEGQLEAAQEKAEELKTTLEQTKQAAEELQSTFDNYDSVINKLDECTAGTDEWNAALRDVNNTVLEMIQKYPQLLTMMRNGEKAITRDHNGVLRIADWARDQMIEDSQTAISNVQIGSIANQQKIRNLELGQQKDQVSATMWNTIVGSNAYITDATTGVDQTADFRDYLLQNLDLFENVTTNEEIEDLITKLATEKYGEGAYALDMNNWITAIQLLLPSIQGLNDSIQTNTEATKMENEVIAENLLQNNEAVQNSDYRDNIVAMAGAGYSDAYNAALKKLEDDGWGTEDISKATGVNDKAREIFKQYAEAAGITNYDLLDTTGTDKNRKFVYRDNITGEEVTVSLNAMRQVYAASQANAELAQNANNLVAMLANKTKEEAAAITAVVTKDSGYLTVGQANNDGYIDYDYEFGDEEYKTDDLADAIEDKTGLTLDDLKELGYTGTNDEILAQFQKDYDAEIRDAKKRTEQIIGDQVDTVNQKLSELRTGKLLDDLSLNELSQLGKILTDALIAGGQEGVDSISTLYEEANEQGKGSEFIQLMSSIDWDTVTLKELQQIVYDLGLGSVLTTEEMQLLIDTMQDVSLSAGEAIAQMSKLAEILGDLKVGDTISPEAYAELEAMGLNVDQYFLKMADGSYQLIADATEFYNIVRQGMRDKAVGAIQQKQAENAAIGDENSGIIKWLNDNPNGFGTFSAGGEGTGGWLDTGPTYEERQGMKALEGSGYFNNITYDNKGRMNGGSLTESGQTQVSSMMQMLTMAGYDPAQLADWQAQIDAGTLSPAAFVAMTNATNEWVNSMGGASGAVEFFNNKVQENNNEMNQNKEVIASTAENIAELDLWKEQGIIDEAAYDQAYESILAKQSGLDLGELQDTKDMIMSTAEASDELADSLATDEKAAAQVAAQMLRYNKAVESCSSNYENWMEVLEEGNLAKQGKILKDLGNAYGDLLDIDGSQLSKDFLTNTENLELMNEAINGSQEAYDQLQAKAAENIYTQYFGEVSDEIRTTIQEISALDSVDVGEKIVVGEHDVANKLGNMYNNAVMAAIQGGASVADAMAQANALMQAIGYEPPEVEMEEKTVTITGQLPKGWTPQPNGSMTGPDGQLLEGVKWTEEDGGTYTYTQTMMVPKATSFTKSSENLGGGGGSKGGGGGGNKKPKEAKEVKKTDVVERYKEIDDSIDDITEAFNNASEAADRLYGNDRIKQMEKVNKLLKDEIGLIEKKKEEAYAYLQEDRENLQQAAGEAGVSFDFDDNGNIANYTTEMTKLFEELDSAIKSANADGDATEDEQEAIDKIQERIDKVKEAIEQYDETKELIEDLDNDIQEKLYEIYDNELEAFEYKVELDLELSEDSMKMIEFQLDQIEDDAFKAAKSIALTSQKAENLYDTLMTNRNALDEAFGLSDIAWDLGIMQEGQEFTEDQIDLMKEYRDNIMDVIEEMSELRETVEEQVMEVFEAWNDKLETNMDTLDHFGSMLDSYKNIVDIVGQDTMGLSEGFMQNMQNASVEHALDQMHATKEAYETMMSARLRAEQALEDARARKDDASAKMWEETLTELNSNMESAQEDMLSSWENALSVIQDNFEATVERVVETFNNAVYAFGGMEGLSNEFSRQKEMADLMVDDYQKIYELSKLNRDIQKTLDDTDVIAGKQKLLKLQEKINALEEEGVELSQYDLEYLQAEYELRMAEIELANAQAKKDTVRLSKDNEGNWSYIYTTSTDAVDQAQQKYEDALYAMQELSSNYVDEMSEQLISTSQEMAEALAEVRASDFASQEDYEKELDRIRKMYQERLDQQEAELQKSINNNRDLYTQDWTNYHEATGYKISDTENFVTSFKDTLLGALMDSESDTVNFNNIMSSSVDILTTGLVDAAATYYSHMEQAMQAAGTSTNDFAADMQENIDTVVQKSEEGAAAIEDMAEKMASAFWDISDSVNQWQEGYGSAMQQVIDSNLAVIESFNNMLKELSIDPDAIKVEYDISTDYSLENASSMDTGGYTGTWGAAGKLAILHEKELVLNPDDTSNFLQAIGISKTLLETIDLNAKQASNGMGLLSAAGFRDSSNGTLEQNVHIEATFPNVTDHNEIEEAMKNLVNTASQYANRK